jgi:hypothetical protein
MGTTLPRSGPTRGFGADLIVSLALLDDIHVNWFRMNGARPRFVSLGKYRVRFIAYRDRKRMSAQEFIRISNFQRD